jgi:hypothetical protein
VQMITPVPLQGVEQGQRKERSKFRSIVTDLQVLRSEEDTAEDSPGHDA